jgi:hypothetical protein
LRYRFWGKLQAILYKPVYAWGTYYVWDQASLNDFLEELNKEEEND